MQGFFKWSVWWNFCQIFKNYSFAYDFEFLPIAFATANFFFKFIVNFLASKWGKKLTKTVSDVTHLALQA